jgi:hypothetical protein
VLLVSSHNRMTLMMREGVGKGNAERDRDRVSERCKHYVIQILLSESSLVFNHFVLLFVLFRS